MFLMNIFMQILHNKSVILTPFTTLFWISTEIKIKSQMKICISVVKKLSILLNSTSTWILTTDCQICRKSSLKEFHLISIVFIKWLLQSQRVHRQTWLKLCFVWETRTLMVEDVLKVSQEEPCLILVKMITHHNLEVLCSVLSIKDWSLTSSFSILWEDVRVYQILLSRLQEPVIFSVSSLSLLRILLFNMMELFVIVKIISYKNYMVKTPFPLNTSRNTKLAMLSFLKKLLELNMVGIKKYLKLVGKWMKIR